MQLNSGVYIVLNKNSGYVKIGESQNVFKRLEQIKNSLRFSGKTDKVELVYYVYIPIKKNRCMMETYLHNKYKPFNISNEWFDCDIEDVKQTMINYKNAMRW